MYSNFFIIDSSFRNISNTLFFLRGGGENTARGCGIYTYPIDRCKMCLCIYKSHLAIHLHFFFRMENGGE